MPAKLVAANVSASDGLVAGVDVSWTQPGNTKAAQVWRFDASGKNGVLIATIARGPYHDAAAIAGVHYKYAIKLQGPTGPFGALSALDDGYAATLPPPPPPPLTISTSSLPAAQVGVPYAAQIDAAGGTPPYTASIASGSMASGLVLSQTGAISGTPTTQGSFAFGVREVDAAGQSTSKPLSIDVAAAAPTSSTRIPPATSFKNSAGVWTLLANTDIQLNGVYVNGRGTILDCGADLIVYTLGTDSPPNWYQWRGGSDWSFLGPVDPRDDPSVLLPAPILPPPPSTAAPFILSGVAYGTLQQAHDAASNGDTIKVRYSPTPYVIGADGSGPTPGCNVSKSGLTIEWEVPGLMPKFDISAWALGASTHGGSGTAINMGPPCTSLTVRGLDITGYPAPYNPQTAFVNVESGYPYQFLSSTPYTLLVEICAIRRFTNGILCGPNPNGVITLRGNLFEDCGAGDGVSHGSYISAIREVIAEGNTYRTTPGGVGGDVGHLFKSRARKTTLIANVFDGKGSCSRNIDICNGGELVGKGNFFHKYADGEPNQCIRYGAEQRANAGNLDAASGFPRSFDNTGFTADFCHDGRVHSIFLAQNTLVNDADQQLLLVDVVIDDNKNPVTIAKTIRNNVAAGAYAKDITQFANNSAVQPAQIDASGHLTIAEITGTQNDAAEEYAGLFKAPNPRSDSCCGAFEESIVAGSAPTWLSAPVNQWTEIPNSTPSLYLKNDGTGVLPAAFTAGGDITELNYRQCDSYGAPCWSEKYKEIHRFGGGHAATNMNPLVKARLDRESPDWVAQDPGSNATTINADWTRVSPAWGDSGYVTDGRPKSTHVYRGLHYFDAIDELVLIGSGATNDPKNGHGEYADSFGWPRSGNAWRPPNYWPPMPGGGTVTDSVQCDDPNGNGAFLIRNGSELLRLDAPAQAWWTIGPGIFHNWLGGQPHEADRMGAKAGQILAITIVGDWTAGVPYSLRFIDAATGVETPLTLSGAALPVMAVTFQRPTNVVYGEATGKWYVTFCTDDQQFGSSPQPLYSITPTGPNTADVALVSVTGTQPTGGLRGGLYYSRGWKCLIAYNGWSRPMQFLRIE